jgi:hypothetical protein
MLIILNNVGPVYFNINPGFMDQQNAYEYPVFNWGTFDGSTNPPILYPNGSSLAELEQEVVSGTGENVPVYPWAPVAPQTNNNTGAGGAGGAGGGAGVGAEEQPPPSRDYEHPVFNWRIFDGSTNLPILYPNGSSLAELEQEVISGTGENVPVYPWAPVAPPTNNTTTGGAGGGGAGVGAEALPPPSHGKIPRI